MATEGALYFIEVDTLERLDIMFVPDELNLARSPNVPNLQVIGKNLPDYQYTGGETTLQLRLDFFAEQENRRDVIVKCKWLESLQYNNGFKSPPSKIKLIFGDLFRDDLWIVKGTTFKFSLFNKQYGYMPQQAYVDITLALDPDTDLSSDDIRNQYGGPSVPSFI